MMVAADPRSMSASSLLPVDRSRLRQVAGLAVAFLLVLAHVAAVTLVSGQIAHAAAGSLTVSPSNYVGGQRLTWTGNVGQRGARPLVLQAHMGRPGDVWSTVDGFRDSTFADGSFSFTYPAPSMFNIRYRVKAGEYVSPSKLFYAKTQELTIRVTGQPENNTNEPGTVASDRPFGITVDTTPENIYRSPDSHGLPVYRGRMLTLQSRLDGDTWRTLDTTTVDRRGLGEFFGLTAPDGVVVYRVRAENVFTNGNRIGWTQSFPLYVFVGRQAQVQAQNSTQRSTFQATSATAPAPVSATADSAFGATASQRYGWQPALWDFAWEAGQSLTSRPARGTNRKGSWLDYSDGSGRAVKYNGGLSISSKRYNGAGPGDFGTTRTTLQGNAATFGRWEASMRVRSAYERGGRGYNIAAELVPANSSDYDCGRHNIQIASMSPFSQQVRFGVRSPEYRWSGTAIASTTPSQRPYRVAVEISRRHITWFLNGAPVGSVTDSAALSGVPMTLRLSLEGDGQAEMDQASLISDWQRGFPIDTAPLTVSPKKLVRGSAATSCGR
jgi:hypothetical protein